MPPLRERREDIPLLAEYLLDKLCSRMGRSRRALGRAALEKLAGYGFPGNVRELENILERALIFCEGPEIAEDDIDIHTRPDERAAAPRVTGPDTKARCAIEDAVQKPRTLEEIEKNTILEALERCGGNRTRAAEELGITRKTIMNKLRNYGITE
jgi:DNA-binding NtrC family response regulator